jgi:CRP-like cAMP-binding protein
MYDCPHSATVTASSPGVAWGLERTAFRAVVVEAMEARRDRREALLRKTAAFGTLAPQLLAAAADCLAAETFSPGDAIMRRGRPVGGEARVYVVQSGTVHCYPPGRGGAAGMYKVRGGQGVGCCYAECAVVIKS